MQRDPVPARWVGTMRELAQPGDFMYETSDKGLFYMCPCGCGQEGFIPFCTTPPNGRTCWTWDQNRGTPTLQPSIRRVSGCKYHGFLQNGQWTFVADSGQ